MTALLIAGTAWALFSAPLALLIGKVIGEADRRDAAAALAADPDHFFAATARS